MTCSIPDQITLCEFRGTFRWANKNKQWISPIFTSLQAAIAMPGKMPLLTDDQWSQLDLPKEIPTIVTVNLNTD